MGYSGGDDQRSASITIPIAVCMGISLYNVIELNVLILTTFKTRKSLYFWSFLAATNGIAPHTIGFLLKNLFILKLVLAMIITNAVVLHIPIIILMYGANSSDKNPWVHPYQIYEKIQVTVFFFQELIISAIYIKACSSFFGTEGLLYRKGVRRMRRHLLFVNVIIILLDIPILVLEFADFYDFQTAYKAIVYSIKLKLEFNLLNRLVEVAKGNDTRGTENGNQIVHLNAFEQDGAGYVAKDSECGNMARDANTKRRKRGDSMADDRILIETEISVTCVERREDDNDSTG
uniref:DUF7703 domain-containing protein n=1 Tax=Fusarium oxysporum (strain Fo5176) TaxID=660025 RepID=A0A0D2YGJ4_FUSOF